MEKKGFLLMVGLFVLVAAACAPTISRPGLTAPEALEMLLGKWSGAWEIVGPAGLRAIDCSMVIKKVDLDQKIIEINHSWTWIWAAGEEDVRAEYIPPDKFKFRTKHNILFEYQLKDGILWGTSTGNPNPQFRNRPGKIKLTKTKE